LKTVPPQKLAHFSSLIVILLVLVLLKSIDRSFAQAETTLLCTQADLANVKVGDVNAFSIRWVLIGEDCQISWFAFNDESACFALEIVFPNTVFRDPFDFTEGYWTGEISPEGRATFVLKSDKGPISVTLTPFKGGPIPVFGRPSTAYRKTVATEAGSLYDILLGDEHRFSFSFSLIENSTIPLLRIYDLQGNVLGEQPMTAFMLPYEYGGVEGVGFMMRETLLNQSIVKWIIYSSREITVKPSGGWVIKPLPFAVISPDRVDPNQLVTLRFVLPEGATTYETNLYQYPVSQPTHEYDASTKEHVLSFQFYPEARGKQFTILVSCTSYGARYQSELLIEVLPYAYEPYLPSILGTIGFIIFLGVIIKVIRGRTGPLSPDEVDYLTE